MIMQYNAIMKVFWDFSFTYHSAVICNIFMFFNDGQDNLRNSHTKSDVVTNGGLLKISLGPDPIPSAASGATAYCAIPF